MNDPIKVIYKVKNDNGKPQYYVYIYVGHIPENIMRTIEKIKNLSLYDSLISLTNSDIKELESFYGNKWYTHFFNKYHIESTFSIIKSNKHMHDDILKKMTDTWFNEHINIDKKDEVIEKKYTYGMIVKRNLVHHELRKYKQYDYVQEDFENYRTLTDKKQHGGADEEQIDDTDGLEEDPNGEYAQTETMTEETDTELEEEDIEDLEKMYTASETVSNKELEATTSMLKKVLEDENVLAKKESKMIKFDVSKDTNMYKENLSDVFMKNYVTEQYIFKDDTIKVIKNKICCSIKNNPKYGKKSYLIPTRQYLWGEYTSGTMHDKIMIGTKWLQKTELLKIDIEPNENIKVYEELRDAIRVLKNDMKRFNSRIKKEDDDNNILFDYDGYFDNDEIYLVDIYNELGKGYTPSTEALSNIIDTYIHIYFPKISQNEIRNIIDYLNDNVIVEKERIISIHNTISADLLIENEIVNVVEKLKFRPKYKHIMKENYVTQSMIHLLLHSSDTDNFRRIDLSKIFDDIIPSSKYPFMQYMTPDGKITFKLNEVEIKKYMEDKNVSDIITTWLQNVSYGLNFRIRTDDMKGNDYRFMSVNMNEVGRMDYKIQWKEMDRASVDDISKTYKIIKELIEEINSTTMRRKFDVPNDSEFKTAFITTIQRFELDKEYTINHNDLSKFARYFYPYFALVIEPRKRVSKIHEADTSSKFGTYLRYKRISKYENISKIEQRIYYFLKNYECTEESIVNEISKQFNITTDKASEHLKRALQKYPHIRKTRKELKKFDVAPKYKSPGIDIEILGKTRDKYKIRVSGARDKQQLERIMTTLNILLYLYMETYIAKKTEWQFLKDKLKKLNNIAERRHNVTDVVKYSEGKLNIKAMAALDKKRIGYKPEKGQSHWTRVCQNSGDTQRRRPLVGDKVDEILQEGYRLNKSTGMYEKKVVIKKNGKNVTETIRAVKLNDIDEDGNPSGNEIYYTCSPEQNGIHMYVGFLTRSKNPNGEPMPCCFKRDQYLSSNEDKRNFFLQSIGKSDKRKEQLTSFSDQLYILSDTNKIQQGRFGFLPNILNFYLNTMLNLRRVIVQHNLVSAPDGYFFKYGIQHIPNSFISAVGAALNLKVEDIIDILTKKLLNDKNDQLFASLNNGEIKTIFKTRDKYMEYIKDVEDIEYENIYHIITTPNIIEKSGLNIIVFAKTVSDGSSQITKDHCYVLCQNAEEIENITDKQRETILLFKEHNDFFPIFNVIKKDSSSKDITRTQTYTYVNNKSNIIEHIKQFYYKSCMGRTIKSIVNKGINFNAKTLVKKLIDKNNNDYLPKYQYIDSHNKCRFIITNNGTLLPVSASGSIYNIQIINDIGKYYDTYANTLSKIEHIYKSFDGDLPIKPNGVNGVITGTNMMVEAIILQTTEIIPIISENISVDDVKKDGLNIDMNPNYGDIDRLISKKYESTSKSKSVNVDIDERIRTVNYEKYENESYELFRYTISEYINKKDNVKIKEKISKYVGNDIDREMKLKQIRLVLYRIVDIDSYKLFARLADLRGNEMDDDTYTTEIDSHASTPNDTQRGGKYDKFIQIIDKLPNTDNYVVNNSRELCTINEDKNMCVSNPHCGWVRSGCMFAITRKMAIIFINKLSSELLDNEMKRNEILQLENYFVSDVVNKNYYTERPNQIVIKSTNENLKKLIGSLTGRQDIDIEHIGRQKHVTREIASVLEVEYPIKDFGNRYIQTIIPDNNSILRAYANGFNWLDNKYQDMYIRNMGYYSKKQTDIMVYLKSMIIDWALDQKNDEKFNKLLTKYSGDTSEYTYITKLSAGVTTYSNGLIELSILNQINHIPIVIYESDMINVAIDDKMIVDEKDLEKYESNNSAINIQYNCAEMGEKSGSSLCVPYNVSVIYYK